MTRNATAKASRRKAPVRGVKPTRLDPVLVSVMANRMDGIVREMTNTLLRAARSAVISSARDFSCCIVTGDNQLLASAEGLPVHIFGAHLQTARFCREHVGDIREGDAYLDNDPYGGNTHPADHTFMVPVFFEGEHLFTTVAKCHMADIGNSIPSSYFARAHDVYEEGALVFPAVRIQRGYRNVGDIERMCRARIRVPDQWYGDYLAGLGSARIAERRLKEFCAKYGKATVKRFIAQWLDYSEARMADAIKRLPRAHLVNTGRSDPLEGILPDGLELKVILDIDPGAATIRVDLSDNPPCVDCGLNTSESAATSAVVGAIFNSLERDIPRNAGSFRRLGFKYAKNSVVAAPVFPHSCSLATTNVSERLVNITQSAFAKLGDGFGLAEGGTGLGAGMAVISGKDHRRGGARYVNRMMLSTNGGPASPTADGWVNYAIPVIAGLMYRDSVEVDELKHPIRVESLGIVTDSAGAGRRRGAPAQEIVYTPRDNPVTVVIPCDGQFAPPRGVNGGHDGTPGGTWLIGHNGDETKLPNLVNRPWQKGEALRGRDSSGGGYGDPLEREAERVRLDVIEGWESIEKARDIYGVIFTGRIEDDSLRVDEAATRRRRAALGRNGRNA
ncbi:MAG: hydantoinase B/oxoprolinase family protein [Alphaproteobacteria bacterium]